MQLIFVYLVSIFAYEMGKRIENIDFLSVYNINKFRGPTFDESQANPNKIDGTQLQTKRLYANVMHIFLLIGCSFSIYFHNFVYEMVK